MQVDKTYNLKSISIYYYIFGPLWSTDVVFFSPFLLKLAMDPSRAPRLCGGSTPDVSAVAGAGGILGGGGGTAEPLAVDDVLAEKQKRDRD